MCHGSLHAGAAGMQATGWLSAAGMQMDGDFVLYVQSAARGAADSGVVFSTIGGVLRSSENANGQRRNRRKRAGVLLPLDSTLGSWVPLAGRATAAILGISAALQSQQQRRDKPQLTCMRSLSLPAACSFVWQFNLDVSRLQAQDSDVIMQGSSSVWAWNATTTANALFISKHAAAGVSTLLRCRRSRATL